MRSWTRFAATLFLILISAAAFFIVDSFCDSVVQEAQAKERWQSEYQRRYSEDQEEIRKVFAELEACFVDQEVKVLLKTRRAHTSSLKEALSHWESEASNRATWAARITEEVHAQREALGLDLLLLVTQENEVFSAGAEAFQSAPPEKRALARAGVVVAAEPFFRHGQSGSGVEVFPAEYCQPPPVPDTNGTYGRSLFITAGHPIWIRPDAPHSVLFGGISLDTMRREMGGPLERSQGKLLFHVIADDPGTEPRVVLGDLLGTPVRRGFFQKLLKDGSTSEPAFEGDLEEMGHWALLRSREGQVLGGWGVTIARQHLAQSAIPVPVAPSFRATIQDRLDRLVAFLSRDWPYYCAAGGVALGAFLLFLVFRAPTRARTRKASVQMSPISSQHSAASVPVVPAAAADDLVSQFEISWKTFASYTQDLLQEKLKELADAPQHGAREVREQMARLSDVLLEIKKDLSLARDEAKTSADGVIEKVTLLVEKEGQDKGKLSADGEAAVRKMEGDFEHASARLGHLHETVTGLARVFGERQDEEIQERVKAEAAKLEKDWNERVAAFAAEIDEAKRQGQSLLEEIARGRDAEAALRGDLSASAEREEALRRQLMERDAEVEAIQKDRETAWRREREVIEEIHVAHRRDAERQERIEELGERIEGLERDLTDGKLREEDLAGEADEARASEEKHREAIKEIYRQEGRFQKELEQKLREFEVERAAFEERLRILEARNAELEASSAEDSVERERLHELAEARLNEHEALRRAFDAIKEEKAHFEREMKRLEDEAGSLRAEQSLFDSTRLLALEEENDHLRLELPAARDDLRACQQALASAEESLDRHRLDLDEAREDKTRAQEQLRLLRGQLEAAHAETARLRQAAEKREEEFGPAKDALEKALQSSLAELKRLRESSTREGDSRLSKELAEKLRQAHRVEVERLERTSLDLEKRLRASEEERLGLKAKLAEGEAQVRSRLAELELKAAEAERKVSEAARRQANAESTARTIQAQLETSRSSSRPADDTLERMRSMEREKNELLASLDRVGKELERVREEAEGIRRFQGTLVDGCLPAAFVAVDTSLKVFAWNPRAESLWGRPAAGVLGRVLPDLAIRGLDRDAVDLARKATSSRESVGSRQTSFTDEGGKVRHVRIWCDPILGRQGGRDPAEEVLGVVLSAEDITEKVEHEIEAKLQSLFSQSLTRSMPGALVVLDGQRRVISWNRSAESFFGIGEKEALGEDFFALATPLGRDVFRRYFEASKRDSAPHRVRVRLDLKGAPAQCVVSLAPFLGTDDSVRGTILLVQHDATELAEARK